MHGKHIWWAASMSTGLGWRASSLAHDATNVPMRRLGGKLEHFSAETADIRSENGPAEAGIGAIARPSAILLHCCWRFTFPSLSFDGRS